MTLPPRLRRVADRRTLFGRRERYEIGRDGASVVTEDPVAELGAMPGLDGRRATFLVWLADEANGAWMEAPAWLLADGRGGPYLLVRRLAGDVPVYEACWAPDGPVVQLDADQFERAARRNTHPADASPSMAALDELHARGDATTWVAWGPAALVTDPSRLPLNDRR